MFPRPRRRDYGVPVSIFDGARKTCRGRSKRVRRFNVYGVTERLNKNSFRSETAATGGGRDSNRGGRIIANNNRPTDGVATKYIRQIRANRDVRRKRRKRATRVP